VTVVCLSSALDPLLEIQEQREMSKGSRRIPTREKNFLLCPINEVNDLELMPVTQDEFF
jgi:hypothetical protein